MSDFFLQTASMRSQSDIGIFLTSHPNTENCRDTTVKKIQSAGVFQS